MGRETRRRSWSRWVRRDLRQRGRELDGARTPPQPNNANVPYRPLFGGSLAGGSPDRLVALSPSGREVYIHGDPPGGWRMMDVRCPSYPDRGISALMSTERGIVSVINPNPGSAKRAASLCSTDSGSEVQIPWGPWWSSSSSLTVSGDGQSFALCADLVGSSKHAACGWSVRDGPFTQAILTGSPRRSSTSVMSR